MIKYFSTAIALCATLFCSSAQADQVRFSFGAGVTSAGSVNGGLALGPTFTYAFDISENVEIALTNTALFTGLVYKNIGIIDENLAQFGAKWKAGYINVGPSVSFMSTILCSADKFCNRVSAVAPGGQIGGAYFDERMGGRLGFYATVNLIYIPSGAIYTGVLGQANAGLIFRLGKYE